MLDSQDIKQIRQVVTEEVNNLKQVVDGEIKDLKQVVSGEIKDLKRYVKDEIKDSEKRIIGEIGTFIEDQVLPQFDEKADKTDIDRLERKLDIFSAKVANHDQDIQKIKSHLN